MTRAAVLEDPNAPDWTSQALAVLEKLATEDRAFTSETLTTMGVPNPPSSGMWGNLFRQAARNKIIRKVDYRPSNRPSRRGGSGYAWQGCAK